MYSYSYLHNLPANLTLVVLTFLDEKDLIKISSTGTKMRTLIYNNSDKEILREHHPERTLQLNGSFEPEKLSAFMVKVIDTFRLPGFEVPSQPATSKTLQTIDRLK